MSKYKAAWVAFANNETFWNEVLVGRTITRAVYGTDGLVGFDLDSGEYVRLWKNEHGAATICIEDDWDDVAASPASPHVTVPRASAPSRASVPAQPRAVIDAMNTATTSGTPAPGPVKADGQNSSYVVLAPEELAKGFVRPVRDTYRHTICGVVTTMSGKIAETYAAEPKFYANTFCVGCRGHFPVSGFVWDKDGSVLGS